MGKDGSLTTSPVDPIHFKAGAYDTTYVAYFDDAHTINVDGDSRLVINAEATVNSGNSVIIRPAKTFNPKAALAQFPVVEVTEIALSHSSATLMAGEALALQATVSPSYATDPTVTWSTSDASVAIVVRGVVTAVSPGTATITAKAGDKEATCVVTVEKRYVEVLGLILSHSTASVTEGETLTLIATVAPEDADDKTVTWETSDASIATVKDGVVTGIVPGKATITAKAGGRQAACEVTVKKRYVPVTDIILSDYELEVGVGKRDTIIAVVLPENADNKAITWISSDVKVARVVRGIVLGVSEGTAIITAETDDYSVDCVVTVKNVVDGIELTEQEDGSMDVYDITGRLIRLKAKSLKGLAPGVYVVNGRKIVVK